MRHVSKSEIYYGGTQSGSPDYFSLQLTSLAADLDSGNSNPMTSWEPGLKEPLNQVLLHTMWEYAYCFFSIS